MNFARVTLVTRALPIHGKARTSNTHRDIMGLTMRMLEALRSFMFSKYRWLGFIGLFLLAVFVIPHYAYADYGVDTANTIVSYFVATLTTILSLVLAMIGNIILTIIEILLVPVLQYNEFASSKIIGIGWSLVRDVMNMFVVAVLIVIAMFTILNVKKAAWEQNLKNLFFAVVLMNFSRTICGVLIDISQVVMLTFVNALLDIAAGNFAQMLGINKFGAFDDIAVSTLLGGDGQGTGITAATGLFMSTLAQIPLYLVIFGVLLAMAIAFLYRIVVLWILTIMSPMAFFMAGVKDIMPSIASGEKQWWSKFISALLMGPILAFFLWLALSVSSSGNLLQNEGFKLPVTSAAPRFIVDSLGSAQLGATLIAIVLLITGMGIAAEQAKNIGGLAASWVTEGWAKKLATAGFKGAARTGDALITSPVRAVGAGLGLGGLMAGDAAMVAGKTGFTGAADKLNGYSTSFGDKGRTLRRLPTLEDAATKKSREAAAAAGGAVSGLGAFMGSSTLMGAGGALAGISKKGEDAQRADAKKRIAAMTSEEKLARLRGIEQGNVPNDLESEEIAGLLRADFVKSKSTQNKYEEKYDPDKMLGSKKALLKESINKLSTGNLVNEWMEGADLDKQKHKNFHLLSTAEQDKFKSGDAFDPKSLSQDALDDMYKSKDAETQRVFREILDSKNDKGESFGDRLRDRKVQGLVTAEESTTKKSAKSLIEDLTKAQGKRAPGAAPSTPEINAFMASAAAVLASPKIGASVDAQKAIVEGAKTDDEKKARRAAFHDATVAWLQVDDRKPNEVLAAVMSGALQKERITQDDLDVAHNRNATTLTLALARAGADATSPGLSPTVATYYRDRVNDIGSRLNAADDASRKTAVSLASGAEGKGLSLMDTANRDVVRSVILDPRTVNDVPRVQYQQALKNLVKDAESRGASDALAEVFSGVNFSSQAALNFNGKQREISSLIKEELDAVRYVSGAIDPVNSNDVSRMIMKAVNSGNISKYAQKIPAADSPANIAKRDRMIETLEHIASAAAVEASAGGKKTKDKADNLGEQINTLLSELED